jgi:Uma2 family endonuclease
VKTRLSTLPKTYLTPEQYLEIERKAEFKSEYYQGEMFAMSGARYAHIKIVANAVASLHQQLRRGPCEPLSNDMRVSVAPNGLYAYPDIVIVCGKPQFLDDTFDTLLNPTVIVEVLSESTQVYDRIGKFELYRSLESLAEYVLISSLRVSVERYTHQPDGSWNYIAKASLEDSIDLKSVDCHLLLTDLYEKVDFSPSEPASGDMVR